MEIKQAVLAVLFNLVINAMKIKGDIQSANRLSVEMESNKKDKNVIMERNLDVWNVEKMTLNISALKMLWWEQHVFLYQSIFVEIMFLIVENNVMP